MTGLVLLVGVLWVFGGLQSGVLAQDGGKFSYPRALERLESLVATLNESLHETKEDLYEVRLGLNVTKKILRDIQGEKESLEAALLETRRELAATKILYQQEIDELRAAQGSSRVEVLQLEKGLKRVKRKVNGLEDEQLSGRLTAIENEKLPRRLNDLTRNLRRLEDENLPRRMNQVFIKLLTAEIRHNSTAIKLKKEQRQIRSKVQVLETKLEAASTQWDVQNLTIMLQDVKESSEQSMIVIKKEIVRSNTLAAKQQNSMDRLTIKMRRQGQNVNQLNDSVTDQGRRLVNLTSIVEAQDTCIASLKEDVKKIKRGGIITDCYDAMTQGYTESGVYTIQPINTNNSGSFNVYCDMETDGGGWAVLLKRQDGSVDFYRNWTDYKSGFGNLEGEHWLGLNNMYLLTHQSSAPPQLRVDLADWEGNTTFAKYDQFTVGAEDSDYTLSVSGYQSTSTAGNSLTGHNGQRFSTPDRDNDVWDGHCAVDYHGPWWHWACYYSLLTGKYYASGGPRTSRPYGVNWNSWTYVYSNHYSLRVAEMKIRPGGV